MVVGRPFHRSAAATERQRMIPGLCPGPRPGQLQTVAGAKGPSRHVQVDQVPQVDWAHAVNSLIRQHTYLIADPGTDWQPVQIHLNFRQVVKLGRSDDESCCRVLHSL